MVSELQRRLLVLCAVRLDKTSPDWNVIAREAQRQDGVARLERGDVWEKSTGGQLTHEMLSLTAGDRSEAERRVDEELTLADNVDAQLITVLDDAYPANLRLVPDLPPFLFVRGTMLDADVRAVAVVGTRQASPGGLARATKMSRLLAGAGVTVVSGLARGIDTSAHTAALDAGGRTIAVLGTGITKCYPKENAPLAERIIGAGALVSQFWPSANPATFTFPRRNVVTSGISQGTVVIEASSTSGAKMQARLALQHGKRVWLVKSLVTEQEWARKYVQSRGAIEVDDVAHVVRDLAPVDRVVTASRGTRQLALELL